jgi:hypothetical protein
MPMHVGWKPEGSYTYDALLVSSSDTRPSAPSTPSTVHYIYKKYYIRTKKSTIWNVHTHLHLRAPTACICRGITALHTFTRR